MSKACMPCFKRLFWRYLMRIKSFSIPSTFSALTYRSVRNVWSVQSSIVFDNLWENPLKIIWMMYVVGTEGDWWYPQHLSRMVVVLLQRPNSIPRNTWFVCITPVWWPFSFVIEIKLRFRFIPLSQGIETTNPSMRRSTCVNVYAESAFDLRI